MKINNLIDALEVMAKENPDAEVRLHGYNGNNLLFVNMYNDPELKNIVWLEDKEDIDMSSELSARFEQFSEYWDSDELDFFVDLVDMGITLEDIKEYLPEQYEYSKRFMEDHGLAY